MSNFKNIRICLIDLFKNASHSIDQDQALTTLREWADTMEKKDPAQVAALYLPGAVFIGTIAAGTALTTEEYEAYFASFFKGKDDLEIEINTANIQLRGMTTGVAGEYTFSYTDSDVRRHIAARYTFALAREEESGKVKIINHHSSANPQIMLAPTPLSEYHRTHDQ